MHEQLHYVAWSVLYMCLVFYNMMDFKLYMMYLHYIYVNEQCCTGQFAYIYSWCTLYMIHSNILIFRGFHRQPCKPSEPL